MCYFLYFQCDRCRWPEINNIRGVILCDEFKSRAQDRGWRAAFAEPEMDPLNLATWRCLGLYTFIRTSGADYDIYKSRDCIRWAPDSSWYLCRHCQARGRELNVNSTMSPEELRMWDAAFKEAEQSLQADVSHHVSPSAQQRVDAWSFEPADIDAEAHINWEALMGPGPLSNANGTGSGGQDRICTSGNDP